MQGGDKAMLCKLTLVTYSILQPRQPLSNFWCLDHHFADFLISNQVLTVLRQYLKMTIGKGHLQRYNCLFMRKRINGLSVSILGFQKLRIQAEQGIILSLFYIIRLPVGENKDQLGAKSRAFVTTLRKVVMVSNNVPLT